MCWIDFDFFFIELQKRRIRGNHVHTQCWTVHCVRLSPRLKTKKLKITHRYNFKKTLDRVRRDVHGLICVRFAGQSWSFWYFYSKHKITDLVRNAGYHAFQITNRCIQHSCRWQNKHPQTLTYNDIHHHMYFLFQSVLNRGYMLTLAWHTGFTRPPRSPAIWQCVPFMRTVMVGGCYKGVQVNSSISESQSTVE